MSYGVRLAALTVIAALGLDLGVAVAVAGQDQYPTAFTKFKSEVENGHADFKGKIDSPNGGCVPDRHVKLLRRKQGATKTVGSDHSDNKGRFVIDLGSGPPSKGTYYAKVKEATIGGQGNKKTCLDRTSGSIKLGD